MRHQRTLRAATMAALTVLVPYGADYLSATTTNQMPPSEVHQAVVEPDVQSCEGTGDVFQLDVPGTYAAFAIGSSDSLLTEVRGSNSELLATSHPTKATASPVDLPSGLRFGVAAPQVFDVESEVTIQVHHDNSPYELMLVRIAGTREFSRLNVRPPVERVVNESGSCRTGDSHETFKIHTDAVYSDLGARQIFVIGSPNGPSMAQQQSSGSDGRKCVLLTAWRSLNRGHSLFTSRFFVIK